MAYLQTALALLRERAYFRDRVDWDQLAAQAGALAAQTPADGYPLLRQAIEALHDHHSFFIGADRTAVEGPQGQPAGFGVFILAPEFVVIEVFPDSAGERAGLRRGDVVTQVNGAPPAATGGRRLVLSPDAAQRLALRRAGRSWEVELTPAPITRASLPQGRYLGEGLGYLELFVQGNPADAQAYIDTAHDLIRAAAGQGARGWVVDLRCNRGGNMWPMLAGAGPLLGDGQVGHFIGADRSVTRWFYLAGAAAYQQSAMAAPLALQTAAHPVPTFDPALTPVAVLTSELTGSSGEMTLIAFLGRPNTRTFGAATTGEITGVAIHTLADGALLGIAESIAADRTGRAYHAAIAPDESLPLDWFRYGQADDPVLEAAVRWLRAQLP